MEKVIDISNGFSPVKMFNQMKVGDIYKIPYDDSRHNGIKSEAARRNRDARLMGKLKGRIDLIYRVSTAEYPGYTSVIKLK